MKSLVMTALICCFYMDAMAGHSQNNGTCDDDITHWANMIEKRSDAPLYEKSKTMAQLAKRKSSVWGCENFMEEALRMIRRTDGEYPTE